MRTAFFVLGLVAAIVAFWTIRLPPPAPSEGTADIPDDRDGQVLRQLAAAGSQLSQPHPIEFFLYFPDEVKARAALESLTPDGFVGRVERSASGRGWLCAATKSIVPSLAAMVALRERMTAVAGAGAGEYDGWGTPVVH